MSQQQFVPEPQDESAKGFQRNEEIDRHLYKSAARNRNMPKEDHPSTFEETIPPYSYRAQDSVTQNTIDPAYNAHFHETNAHERQSRRRRFSPDGDALENGYRSYQQQQYRQVPPWARPQPQKNFHIMRWLVMIIMMVLFIKLIGGLLVAGLALLSLIILIPLIVLGTLILVGSVLAILSIVMGRAVWRSLWRW